MTYYKQTLFIGFFSLLLLGCTPENRDLIHYIHEVRSRKETKVEDLPVFKVLPVFKFPNQEERRSPFTPLSVRENSDNLVFDPQKVKQALERYYFKNT